MKLKKLFPLVAVLAAIGLFVPACVDPDDAPITYSVTLESNVTGVTLTGAGKYEAGQTVSINVSLPSGRTFNAWTHSPTTVTVNFANANNRATTFTMPAADLRIKAWFDGVDGKAEVRFTWEAAEEDNLIMISASYDDMEYWYENVWEDMQAAGDDDFTDFPLFDGSPQLPNNMFSKTLHATTPSPHKSKYFPIDEGLYTAVASVDDPQYPVIWEIVANYVIMIDPAEGYEDGIDLFFEIAFDIGAFLEDIDHDGWDWDVYDNPNTNPKLVKRLAPRLTKTAGGTMTVQYFIFSRPRK